MSDERVSPVRTVTRLCEPPLNEYPPGGGRGDSAAAPSLITHHYDSSMSTSSLWHKAAAFAARAHLHQTRRDDRTPYIAHPARVALIVAVEFGCTDETVLAAALLHDVLEDTTADYDDLLEHFGRGVADLVSCLSKDNRLVEPDREEKYDERLAEGTWQARLIKLADVYDNLADTATEQERQTVLEKVRRAVALAENDPPLQKAVKIVRARMQAAQLRLSSA